MHVGLDDTDSNKGGCTTYLASLITEKLLNLKIKFIDYPNLVRLNPNVPWKTRGNGAVCIRIKCASHLKSKIKRTVLEVIENHSRFDCNNTNPGVVFHIGEIPRELKSYAERVIQSIVTLEESKELIDKHCSNAIGYKNMRGLNGALAAVGEYLNEDHTFELLAYRTPSNFGKPRLINSRSILEMNKVTSGQTFNNFDPETGRILITPRGPDPVLFGIRGETAQSVRMASEMIQVNEPISRWLIFRSNQGTDAHLKKISKIDKIKPNHPSILKGKIGNYPNTIRGGHVIFELKDETGAIDCAAYEPTGSFRKIVKNLIPGDEIIAYGGIKRQDKLNLYTLNLEKVKIIDLVTDIRHENPRCSKCGVKMKSMGHKKGYRCRKCGYREPTLEKQVIQKKRRITKGIYIPTLKAQRHLTKPLERYGREKKWNYNIHLSEPWFWANPKTEE